MNAFGDVKMRTNWPAKPTTDRGGLPMRIGNGTPGKASNGLGFKAGDDRNVFECHADSSDEHSMPIPAELQSNPHWNSDVFRWKPGR